MTCSFQSIDSGQQKLLDFGKSLSARDPWPMRVNTVIHIQTRAFHFGENHLQGLVEVNPIVTQYVAKAVLIDTQCFVAARSVLIKWPHVDLYAYIPASIVPSAVIVLSWTRKPRIPKAMHMERASIFPGLVVIPTPF